MIIIGKPINGVTVNGLEYILDDNGEPMKFETSGHALVYLLKSGYTEQDIEAEGLELIYTNERRQCDCRKCEKRTDCYIQNKFQRHPPETSKGMGLGLCPKLSEQ